jgi:hypothetical protein
MPFPVRTHIACTPPRDTAGLAEEVENLDLGHSGFQLGNMAFWKSSSGYAHRDNADHAL